MLKIRAIDDIDDRNRPGTREIYHLAVGADQDESVGLRQIAQPLAQEAMDIPTAQDRAELLGRLDPGGEGMLARLLDDEIDRLEAAGGLLGQHEAEIFHLLPVVGNRILPQVPDRETGGQDRDADESEADERKATARAEQVSGAGSQLHW